MDFRAGKVIGFWFYNLDKDVLVWDKRMHQIFGVSFADEVVGGFERFATLVHKDDLGRVKEAINACITGEVEQYNATYRVNREIDGSTTSVEAWGSMITMDGNRYLAGLCHVVDSREEIIKELMGWKG